MLILLFTVTLQSILSNKLTMTQDINKLPDQVRPYRLRSDYGAAVREAVNKAQRAAAELWAIEDLPRAKSVEEMNPERVADIINENLTAAEADKSLTKKERARRVKEWLSIREQAMLLTKSVQYFVNEFPDIILCYDPDNGTLSVSEADVQKAIDRRATCDVPGAAQIHWNKLQSIIAAIKDLREWERCNNVNPFLIGDAIDCKPDAFAEVWAIGGNKIDHRFDKYRVAPSKRLII